METKLTALEAIFTRQSIRAYESTPLSEEQIKIIVRAGMFAPSAHNTRSWDMITVTDRDVLNALSGQVRYWGMLRQAPLCIACCAHHPDTTLENEEFLVQNAAAATQNMLLAAHSLGLGACWLGIHARHHAHDATRAILGVPEGVRLVSLMAVGHIAGEAPARREPQERLEEQKWHRERW